MINVLRWVIWLAILAAFLRGLFVFDMGGSAQSTYPTASAVCFVGAILGAILMLRFFESKNRPE
jgi:hypothetical protein